MLKEADIMNQTGIEYLSEGPYRSIHMAPSGILNLREPATSPLGTGEDVLRRPDIQPRISQDLLPYLLLSRTTGSELSDFWALLAFLVSDVASDTARTNYHTAFHIQHSVQTKRYALPTPVGEALPTTSLPEEYPARFQAERLREISGLKIESLASIFGVSRTTYYKWLSGLPLRNSHREHLLEVLPLIEEAAQRLCSPIATSTWLLTPATPAGKKPIDYLAERQYSIFSGFLLRVRTGREFFQPLSSPSRVRKERSQEEIEDGLARLRPRAWRDEAEHLDTSDDDEERR